MKLKTKLLSNGFRVESTRFKSCSRSTTENEYVHMLYRSSYFGLTVQYGPPSITNPIEPGPALNWVGSGLGRWKTLLLLRQTRRPRQVETTPSNVSSPCQCPLQNPEKRKERDSKVESFNGVPCLDDPLSTSLCFPQL